MKKTERLLQLLQVLRNYRYAVRGEQLAARLGISIRTLYRDISALQAMGAQIQGEAGVGYILKPSFFLPPLMFSELELKSLVLGTQWVSQYGDAPLAKSAKEALNKIYDVVPANIKNDNNTFTLRVGPPPSKMMSNEDLSPIRNAIEKNKKVKIHYKLSKNKEIQQLIWPFTIGYFTDKRILVAWCEEKSDYQYFDTNKIISFEILSERYSSSKNDLFLKWQKIQLKKHFKESIQ